MGGYIFLLKSRTFSRMSLIKSLTPCLHNPIKKYSQGSKGHQREMEERAPSTAEEFKRVAEQKLKEAEQGVASQVSDKVKKRFIEHEPSADRCRRGDNDHNRNHNHNHDHNHDHNL